MSTTMSEQDTEQELPDDIRRRVLEDSVLLVSPTVGRWEGRLKIPKEKIKIEIDDTEVDTAKAPITTPNTVLMNDKWPVDRDGKAYKKRFLDVFKLRDRTLRKYSIPFAQLGTRIIPKHKGVDFFSELIGVTLGMLRRRIATAIEDGNPLGVSQLEERIAEAVRENPGASDTLSVWDPTKPETEQSFTYQYQQLTNEFCADLHDRTDVDIGYADDDYNMLTRRGGKCYPTSKEGAEYNDMAGRYIALRSGVLSQIKTAVDITLPGVWPLIQNRVPHTAALMRAKFYCTIYPVELSSGTQFKGITASLLADYKDVVNQSMQAAVDGCIEQVIDRPRADLCDVLVSLRDRIARDAQLNRSAFETTHTAIEKLRLFEFACPPSMLTMLDNFSERLSLTNPTALDSVTAVSNGFMEILDTAIAELSDEVKAEQDFEEFGKEFRSIDLG